MTTKLRVGQKVHIADGVITGVNTPYEWANVDIDGVFARVPWSALTPVVDPEPSWTSGDVVSIDGENWMLRSDRYGILFWSCAKQDRTLYRDDFSRAWFEGRVEVIYRKGAEK